MASAAEQLAANINLSAFSKATDLKKRIWFTLGALIVYRLGTYIPLPGIDPIVFQQAFNAQAGGVLGMFNLFSGGALERMTILALNIMPYISASIIMQLMTAISPQIEALKKEGEAGRKKINQYTRYGTVVLAAVQAYGIARGLQGAQDFGAAVINPGLFFELTTVITLTGGTIFLMWLGEQITQRGIGNGISLIIFSGIVAGLPAALAQTFQLSQSNGFVALIILLVPLVIAGIVCFERAHRKVIVQYPKRQVGNKMFGGDSSHLPIKLNVSGVIPPIFASSLLLMPITAAQFSAGSSEWLTWVTANLGRGTVGYMLLFSTLIAFFAFFYKTIVFNTEETADNLKKNGGFVPGIRPGKNTAAHLDYIINRLTIAGAAYLVAVCLLPEILISQYAVPFYFGGTSLLIVVSVTMDTVGQIHSHLVAHQYEGLIKKSKLKGRRG
ncbi:preprotein translocase subunit SecY [uncultured Kiloniella sp.]|uniref:preprotein translocase subunit SecY n=1 Tax=Kiloniella sp. TaxID=1938587 RepID=UPI002638203F|nr:preprotein translocase subunit SecY [uncultured Kiloniella sp.]